MFCRGCISILILGVNASLADPAVPWINAYALIDVSLFLVIGVWATPSSSMT